MELVLAVRNRHLDLLLESVRPGGFGILISDFVSTMTAPELATLSDREIVEHAKGWLERGNFFTGANPFMVAQHLQNHPSAANVQLLAPWRWDMKHKQFAVFGCIVRTKLT